MTEPKPQYNTSQRGRPPLPADEKFRPFSLKLPPVQIAWLRQRRDETGVPMGTQIQEMIAQVMLIEKTVGVKPPCQTS